MTTKAPPLRFDDLIGAAFLIGLIGVVVYVLVQDVRLAAGIGIPIAVGVGFYFYRRSPARQEREARARTWALYRETQKRSGHTFSEEDVVRRLLKGLPTKLPETILYELASIGRDIIADEIGESTVPEPPAVCNSMEGARYRDQLSKLSSRQTNTIAVNAITDAVAESLSGMIEGVKFTEDGEVTVALEYVVPDQKAAVLKGIAPFFQSELVELGLENHLVFQLNDNSNEAGGVPPTQYTKPDVVDAFLAGTPLEDVFKIQVPFAIPENTRFEHQFILGGAGHGKTQCLQHYILKDIEEVIRGRRSVVVIDSQGDLIDRIKRLKGVTEQNCVLVDPNDIEFPVALNLFDVQMDRLMQYPALAREKLINGILELYDFVLGSLLSAELTQKQTVIFRYVTRLMLYIPDATVHTLLDLFQPGGSERYQKYIGQLSGTAKTFFAHEFDSKEFEATKKQVVRRLYGILENQSFERMFTNPRSKVDLFKEMNDNKIILIDTAKGLLKESGTQIFGRFFIAMITQAAQEREEIAEAQRLPCHVYIDEASDYFDENIDIVLSQARKYRVGITMATQYLEQMSPRLQAGIAANTSIKLAGGASARDARRLASEMRCEPDFIIDQPKLTFAAFVRGLTPRAIPMRFEYGQMEAEPQKSREEMEALRCAMRERYATRVEEPLRAEPSDAASPDEPTPPGDEDTPSDAASSSL